jgi:hypothetical protein
MKPAKKQAKKTARTAGTAKTTSTANTARTARTTNTARTAKSASASTGSTASAAIATSTAGTASTASTASIANTAGTASSASNPSTARIAGTAGTANKTFLHVGCGAKHKEQTTRAFNSDAWAELRLDIDKNASPDIVGSMTDMSGVEDASVEAVFSSQNIQHLYPHEVPMALKEFVRVLKPDGFLVLTCPDLQSVCALVAEDKLTEAAYTSPAGPIAPIDILYGHRPALARGNLYMAHRCGFTQRVLTATLHANGFARVAVARQAAPFFALWAVASKSSMEEAALRRLAAEHFPK